MGNTIDQWYGLEDYELFINNLKDEQMKIENLENVDPCINRTELTNRELCMIIHNGDIVGYAKLEEQSRIVQWYKNEGYDAEVDQWGDIMVRSIITIEKLEHITFTQAKKREALEKINNVNNLENGSKKDSN